MLGLVLGRRSRSGRQRPFSLTTKLGALTICAVAALSAGSAHAGQLRVQTREGAVKGFLSNSVAQFLGIPYAEPPVGDLRWRPPKKHTSWSGVRQAKAFGPTCAQITTLGVFAGPANANEDCLYLNVYTPNLSGARLPVVIWIHGGGLVDGESNDYDASKLATQGHVVVVSINYRLNLFGFLAHPALDAEGHLFGNYGLMDQQLAFRWVKRNIAAFGGDGGNVTIGGQSAGASSAAAHVISPLATGLFHRAIFESVGASYVTIPPLSVSEAKGTAFAAAAGCGSGATPAVAKCLRGLSAQKILALSGTESANGPYISAFILDGKLLPQGGVSAFSSGQFNHVPIMNGTVQDEGNFNIAISEYFSGPPRTPVTAAQFKASVTSAYSGNAGPGGTPPAYPPGTVDKVLGRYPLNAFPTAQLALDAVTTDPLACRSRRANRLLADQTSVYAYEFQDRMAPFYFPKMPGFAPLAAHTSDIQFLFPLFHGGPLGIVRQLNKQQEQLSDQLVAAWTNFAWAGNPNGMGQNPWPRYKNVSSRPSMLVENIPQLATMTDAQFSAAHKCDLWDQLLIYN